MLSTRARRAPPRPAPRGAPLGAGLARALLLTVGLGLDWRLTIGLFALLGLIWVALFFIWFRNKPEDDPSCNETESELIRVGKANSSGRHESVPWKHLFSQKNLWFLCGMYFCQNFGWLLMAGRRFGEGSCVRQKRVVLAPVAGVKSAEVFAKPNRVRKTVNSPMTEARGIRLRGERAISRQTIAQGRPDALRWTCMLVCALLCAIAHGIAGAARTRSSLRPLISERGRPPGTTRARRAAGTRWHIRFPSLIRFPPIIIPT